MLCCILVQKIPMLYRSIIMAMSALLLLSGCNQNKVEGTYGEAIDPTAEAVTPDELAALLDTLDIVPVVVRGKISGICHSEGCWMNFVTSDGKKVFVNAKGKQFHLPAKALGHTATVQGEIWSVAKQQEAARAKGWIESEVSAINNISVEATGVKVE
jgi:hypothetical protein